MVRHLIFYKMDEETLTEDKFQFTIAADIFVESVDADRLRRLTPVDFFQLFGDSTGVFGSV